MPLSFASIAQELRWLRPINLIVASSPMKLGACWIFAMVFWKFVPGPALLPACHHCPPPLWGGIWLFHHHGVVVTVDRYGDDSVHGGPLTS